MTVIVAVSDGTRVCMAADSQATSSSGSILQLLDAKFVKIGGVLLGADGNLGIGQALTRNCREIEPIVREWRWYDLADWLRDYLRPRDGLKLIDGRAELPGQMLVAYGSDFFIMDTGGNVVRIGSSYWAIGSGAPEARGAMHHASTMEHIQADDIARAGVRAACDLDDGCSGNIRLGWTNP